LKLVNENNDISRLEQLRTDFEEIMQFIRKERQVTLVTGSDLSAEELDLLRASIKNDYLRPGDTIVFNHQVDSSIAGGMKVVIEGNEVDNSWNTSATKTITGQFREGSKHQFGRPEKFPVPVLPKADVDSSFDTSVFSKQTIDAYNAFVNNSKGGAYEIISSGNK
jgi:hypothetical protein